VHRAGDVTVSVSTAGASPALAQVLRTMIAETLPDNLAEVAQRLRLERAAFHADGSSTEGIDWRRRIHELVGDTEPTH
jgi:siroheme synthase (precorrin-2 oxidase/ferrochelatase)